MPLTPSPSPRRHRTRQRERLLEVLRSTDEHPTAGELHAALVAEFPQVSLGTVYRNLQVLVSEGDADEVPGSGAMRYDANPVPHHHFICESCGAIEDLEIPLPQELFARVRRKYKLRPERARADFYGLCQGCSGRES